MGNTFNSTYPPSYPSKVFSKQLIYRNYGVIPLVALVAWDIAFMAFFVSWELSTREHQIDRTRLPLNLRMDLLNPYWLKLLVIDDELRPGVELDEAYKLMKEAEAGMAAEMKECMKMRKVKRTIQSKTE